MKNAIKIYDNYKEVANNAQENSNIKLFPEDLLSRDFESSNKDLLGALNSLVEVLYYDEFVNQKIVELCNQYTMIRGEKSNAGYTDLFNGFIFMMSWLRRQKFL